MHNNLVIREKFVVFFLFTLKLSTLSIKDSTGGGDSRRVLL